MDRVHLSKLSLPELKVLCRNRALPTKDSKQELAMKSLLIYHRKYGYNKLKFLASVEDWKKEELIPEAKAIGVSSASSFKKSDLAEAIVHGIEFLDDVKSKSMSRRTSRTKAEPDSNSNRPSSKAKSVRKSSSKRTKSSSRKRRKVKKLIDAKLMSAMTTQSDELEKHILKLFNHLNGFSMFDSEELPRHHRHWKAPEPPEDWKKPDNFEDLPSMAEPSRTKVHEFQHKISALLPTVQKALRLVVDVQNGAAPGLYHFGMRRYKSTKEFDDDEAGPFVAVFDDREKWKTWKALKKKEREHSKSSRLSGKKRKRAFKEGESNANPKKKAKLAIALNESETEDDPDEGDIHPRPLPPRL